MSASAPANTNSSTSNSGGNVGSYKGHTAPDVNKEPSMRKGSQRASLERTKLQSQITIPQYFENMNVLEFIGFGFRSEEIKQLSLYRTGMNSSLV